ncbi:MAG: PLD nuclease N-terminal domain-containing protein [Microbacteriaceae bacterium]
MEPISGGLGIIGLIIFIITLVSILRSNHSALGKLGWAAVAFFLSFIGSLLWFLIGRKK